MKEDDSLQVITVPAELAGQRMDQVLARLYPDYSRARLQKWLKDGQILVNGALCRAKDKAAGGEHIELRAEPGEEVVAAPQNLALQVIFEDAYLIVLNKPAGLVVHPAAGNWDGTVQNGLLYSYPELVEVPRAGIVHRLDKETTGLMVVARNLKAHKSLVEQLQVKSVEREYHAVVVGNMVAGGMVDAPVGRHPKDRKRMAVVHQGGKEARTHYRVLEKFRAHTYIKCMLETGRTHQIRVHMAHIRYPLVGDPVYGGRLRMPPGAGEALSQELRSFNRQALHAWRLCLRHPATGEAMEWTADLPADMVQLLEMLRADSRAHA